MQVYLRGLAPIVPVTPRLLVFDFYSMLLKGPRSHTSSTTPFTGPQLVLRASLLKGPRSHTSSTTLFTSSWLVIHGVYCKGIAPNTVSCTLVRTYIYVPTWPGPCCWASQIQLRLVSLLKNRQWLLRLCENARLHVADYNDYSSNSTLTSWVHQQPSATTWLHEKCTATRWRLLQLLVSPTRLVGHDYAWRHAGNYFDYSFCLKD
jgi:hypothetical protein